MILEDSFMTLKQFLINHKHIGIVNLSTTSGKIIAEGINSNMVLNNFIDEILNSKVIRIYKVWNEIILDFDFDVKDNVDEFCELTRTMCDTRACNKYFFKNRCKNL